MCVRFVRVISDRTEHNPKALCTKVTHARLQLYFRPRAKRFTQLPHSSRAQCAVYTRHNDAFGPRRWRFMNTICVCVCTPFNLCIDMYLSIHMLTPYAACVDGSLFQRVRLRIASVLFCCWCAKESEIFYNIIIYNQRISIKDASHKSRTKDENIHGTCRRRQAELDALSCQLFENYFINPRVYTCNTRTVYMARIRAGA